MTNQTRISRSYAPCGQRILVRQDPPASRVGSLYKPDISQAPPITGTVVAVSPEIDSAVSPAVGDRVVFGEANGILAPTRPGCPVLVFLRFPQEVLATFVEFEMEQDEADEHSSEKAATSTLAALREAMKVPA